MNSSVDNQDTSFGKNRYQLLFENMLNGFAYCKMIFDDKGNPDDFIFLEVNKAFEKLTKLTNVIGRPVSEVIPGIKQDNPELFDIYGRVAKSGKPEKFELYLKSLGIDFSISVYSPEVNYFVAVFDNVTEQKKNLTELKENEERLRLALKASKTGVWDWNMVNNQIHWSPEVLSLLGIESFAGTIDELISVIHPEDRERVKQIINTAVKKEEEYEVDFRILRPNQQEIWVSIFGIVHYDANHIPLRMVVATQDVTARKKIEQAVQTKTKELEKFVELTVGREMQMMELKNKISELEKKNT